MSEIIEVLSNYDKSCFIQIGDQMKGLSEEMLKDGNEDMSQSQAGDNIPDGTIFAELLKNGKSLLRSQGKARGT